MSRTAGVVKAMHTSTQLTLRSLTQRYALNLEHQPHLKERAGFAKRACAFLSEKLQNADQQLSASEI